MADVQETVYAGVSFAKTPLAEISGKVAEIVALDWEETGRGDPWAVSFGKDFSDPSGWKAELRAVMGDYWLTAEEIADARSLLDLSKCLRERAERIIAEVEADRGETLAPVLTLVKG